MSIFMNVESLQTEHFEPGHCNLCNNPSITYMFNFAQEKKTVSLVFSEGR